MSFYRWNFANLQDWKTNYCVTQLYPNKCTTTKQAFSILVIVKLNVMLNFTVQWPYFIRYSNVFRNKKSNLSTYETIECYFHYECNKTPKKTYITFQYSYFELSFTHKSIDFIRDDYTKLLIKTLTSMVSKLSSQHNTFFCLMLERLS